MCAPPQNNGSNSLDTYYCTRSFIPKNKRNHSEDVLSNGKSIFNFLERNGFVTYDPKRRKYDVYTPLCIDASTEENKERWYYPLLSKINRQLDKLLAPQVLSVETRREAEVALRIIYAPYTQLSRHVYRYPLHQRINNRYLVKISRPEYFPEATAASWGLPIIPGLRITPQQALIKTNLTECEINEMLNGVRAELSGYTQVFDF